jgi:hypothetical protein
VSFSWFIFLWGKISYEDYKQERSIEDNPFPLNECSDNTYFCGHVFVPNGGYEIFYDCSVRSSEKGNLNTCIGYSGIRRTTYGENSIIRSKKAFHYTNCIIGFPAGYRNPAYYNKYHGVAIGSGTIKIKEGK